MTSHVENPLTDLSADALYRLLGDAWIALFRPETGDADYDESTLELGKREFAILIDDLRRPHARGVAGCVVNAIHRSGSWAMPRPVVVELAVRLGLSPG
jgi:hypothetical protein